VGKGREGPLPGALKLVIAMVALAVAMVYMHLEGFFVLRDEVRSWRWWLWLWFWNWIANRRWRWT